MRPLEYEAKAKEELRTYGECEEVHSLPPIFHFWSNQYLRADLAPFGINGPDDLFARFAGQRVREIGARTARLASIGAGNCELEAALAARLRGQGETLFEIDCIDLNPAMLARGRETAQGLGVVEHLNFVDADFNCWRPERTYDVILANQSLHHVVELERLFDGMESALAPDGKILVSDMVGRNGHRRWPVALEQIWELWGELPPSYRYNLRFGCYEALYVDRDYSQVGFEGIRAQDILPLLNERFDFELFFGFGNLIDPFVDRAFGPHFDPERAWDREFIGRVHERDRTGIQNGEFPPTHLLAVLGHRGRTGELQANVAVRTAIKSRENGPREPRRPSTAYRWQGGFGGEDQEIARLCEMAERTAAREQEQTAAIEMLQAQVKERSEWALATWSELESTRERVLALQDEVEDKNAWALQMDKERMRAVELLTEVRVEVEARTQWARGLEAELRERTEWVRILQEEAALQAQEMERLRQPTRIARWARSLSRWFSWGRRPVGGS